MTTFLTADPHHGHANIIRHCSRPFPSVAQMDEHLIEAWNTVVHPDDTVWVLGDVSMTMTALWPVSVLNGRKLLVPGNHDRCWQGMRKGARAARGRYLDAGFADIIDHPDPLTIAGRQVALSHFPYRGDSRDVERYLEHRPADTGRWLAHGHVHNAWRQRGRQINVGVDAWAGRPVTVDQLAELMTAGPRDLDPLPWTA